MDRSLEFQRRYAIAIPLVRAKAHRLTGCFNLCPFDRDDLEQELWLRLLVRWDQGISEGAEQLPPSALCLHLKREIDDVAASLICSSAFWQVLRPAWRCADNLVLDCANAPTARHYPTRGHELRLDLAAAIAQLPAALRDTYRRIVVETSATEPARAANRWPEGAEKEIAAIREIFTSLGLHEYL